MKKLIGLLSAVALLGLSGLAMAAEAAGIIAQIDPATGVFALEDGSEFIVAAGVSLDGLEPGMPVTVVYEEQGDQKVVTEVRPQG